MAQKGELGVVYIWQTNAYKPFGCLTSTSLSTTVSIIESNTKCFPGVTKKYAGTFNGSISLEGEYIDTTTAGGDTAKKSHDALFLLQQSKTVVKWKLDTNVTDVDSVKYFGDALISDLSADFGSGDDLATFSATLDIDGVVLYTDPNAPKVPVMTSSDTVEITVGQAGTFQITATNTPTSFDIAGSVSLPSGVTLNTTTGLITFTTGVLVGVRVINLQIFNSEGFSINSLAINATA